VSLIGLISASSIATGDWRDDGLVIRTTASNDYNAIDPDLTIDANGAPVFIRSWNSGIKLTRSQHEADGDAYSIASRGGGIEAPVIVQRNGYYHRLSRGLCCQGVNSTYQIRWALDQHHGPYTDRWRGHA
jgi:arabinan endo-1,5-alpha-L-arabinosidase